MTMFRHLLLLTFLLPSLSQAKVFRNAYVAFEMPDSWKCALEQTEWVCRSEASKESKEAVIILTAKEVGPTDTFALYEQKLNSVIQSTVAPTPADAKVVYKSKMVQINDQQWIDGLHYASEVSNYYTRYLATIKDKIAILVTLSAHKNYYTKYSPEFFKVVQSLRVTATKDLFARPDVGPLHPGGESLGAPIGAAMPSDMLQGEEESADEHGGSNGKLRILGAGLLILVAAIILILRRKK